MPAIAERALDGAHPARLRAAGRRRPAALAAAADGGLRRRRPDRGAGRSRRPTTAPSTPGSAVEHLRFGPLEEDNPGFAIAFWPDTKGATPRTLGGADRRPRTRWSTIPAAFAAGLGRGARALRARLPALRPGRAAGRGRGLPLPAAGGDHRATSPRPRRSVLARWRDPWAGYLTSAGAPDNPVYLAPDEIDPRALRAR